MNGEDDGPRIAANVFLLAKKHGTCHECGRCPVTWFYGSRCERNEHLLARSFVPVLQSAYARKSLKESLTK